MHLPERSRDCSADQTLVEHARSNLRDWLTFADRESAPYDPLAGTYITTNRIWDVDNGSSSLPDWIREGWSIRSCLIPLDRLEDAASTCWEDHAFIDVGWTEENAFDFGESAVIQGIEVKPWCLTWRHPVTDEFQVELRPDFLRYHAALPNESGELTHPTENITIAKLCVETHDFFDPQVRVEVHESYLRDFLAARKLGLLIRVVADRYANAPTEADLGIPTTERAASGRSTWMQTTTRFAGDLGYDGVLGRGTLWRSIVVSPADRPLTDRTPWPYFYARPDPATAPTFIVNSQGDRAHLNTAECPRYLWFRPDVLQKYLSAAGHRVRFHMRTWGKARSPGATHTLDVGINADGLVNAFAQDLANQRPVEQSYWSSFSIDPTGEVCGEMYRTNDLNDPPDSMSLFEEVSQALGRVIAGAEKRYGSGFHSGAGPTEEEIDRLTVGPIARRWDEVNDLCKLLHGWVVDRMSKTDIRSAIDGRFEIEGDWGQIKLLESLLRAEGIDAEQAKAVTAPLKGVNKLRVASAHRTNADMHTAFSLIGNDDVPPTPRDGWFDCVDSVAGALNRIADQIEGLHDG